MIRVIVLLVLAGVTAGFAGWQGAKPYDSGISVVRGGDSLAPTLEHPGLPLSVAARAFLDVGLGAPPAPAADATGVELAPAEIDIAVQLRRDLTAVVSENSRNAIWVIDRDKNDARRRILRGGEFRDDWRVHAIRSGEIVLRRADEERKIPIVGDAPPPPAAAPEPDARGRGPLETTRAQKARAPQTTRGNER